MIVFGLVSSVFDYLTFGVLLWLNATVAQFRTGWFIESIVSASLVVLVVRSRRPFFKSRPSKLLALTTGIIVLMTILTAQLPFAGALGFQPMPAHFYPIVAAIIVAYIGTAEFAKLLFYRATISALSAVNSQEAKRV